MKLYTFFILLSIFKKYTYMEFLELHFGGVLYIIPKLQVAE